MNKGAYQKPPPSPSPTGRSHAFHKSAKRLAKHIGTLNLSDVQTLKLLEESTALDELGIGIIRDGYADIFFPGISTLQTRAKYFVLLNYLFSKAEQESFKRGVDILPWIHRQECAYINKEQR